MLRRPGYLRRTPNRANSPSATPVALCVSAWPPFVPRLWGAASQGFVLNSPASNRDGEAVRLPSPLRSEAGADAHCVLRNN